MSATHNSCGDEKDFVEDATMYIGTPNAYTTLQSTLGEAHTGDERIWEGDFETVLKVLAGPSPWQPYIRESLRLTRQTLPSRPFQIVKFEKFQDTMGKDVNISHIPGVTDKRTGIITMQEWGLNSQSTYLSAALHEAVHLVSHPQGRAGRQHPRAE